MNGFDSDCMCFTFDNFPFLYNLVDLFVQLIDAR